MGKRGLPEDFGISESMRAWAEKKVPDVDIDRETENFCDYWRAHAKKMADWPATWRMWMRRAVYMHGARKAPPGRESVTEVLRAREQRVPRGTFEEEFQQRFGCKPQ